MISRRSILKSLAGCAAVVPALKSQGTGGVSGAAAVASGQGHTPAGGGAHLQTLGAPQNSSLSYADAVLCDIASSVGVPFEELTFDRGGCYSSIARERELMCALGFHQSVFPSVAPDFTKPAKPLKHRKIFPNNCVETSAPPLSGKPLAGSPNV